MMRALATLALVACVQGFAPAPLLSVQRRAATGLKMKLQADDFVPSETWYQQYLGQEGIRYSMGKTPDEIEKEGDYNFFEAMFGQTSNNAAKKKLKEQARKKAYEIPNPTESKFWLNKYGHPRFLPAYVDKSGESDPEVAVGTAGTVVDVSKTAANTKEGKSKSFGPSSGTFTFMPGNQPAAGAPQTKGVPEMSPMPRVPPFFSGSADPAKKASSNSKPAAPAAAPKAQAVAAKATAAPKKAARVVAAKVTEAAAAVAPRRERATAAKAKGNLSNLPTKKRA